MFSMSVEGRILSACVFRKSDVFAVSVKVDYVSPTPLNTMAGLMVSGISRGGGGGGGLLGYHRGSQISCNLCF